MHEKLTAKELDGLASQIIGLSTHIAPATGDLVVTEDCYTKVSLRTMRLLVMAAKRDLTMTSGLEMIRQERLRQITEEGFSPQNDDEYHSGELARAAAAYSISDIPSTTINPRYTITWWKRVVHELWPPNWSLQWLKFTTHERNCTKAGALLCAELERIHRKKELVS